MDPKQMMKQLFEFNKMAFERTFSSMVATQDQMEKIFNMFLVQDKMFPDPGKKALLEWIKTCKKGRDDFKEKMEEGYRQIEEYLTGPEK